MRAFHRVGEALQRHAEPEPELVVILELRQAPDGQLRSVQVVEPSGDKAFDKYVSEAVPPALAQLTPPPLKTPGVHLGVQADGIRTLWAVEGRVVYLKHVSEMKEKDAAYAAAMVSLNALAGRFDETTGEVQVINPLDPKFLCRAHLLRLW